MTSTVAGAAERRALTEQQLDHVRDRRPHGEAQRDAHHQADVRRPAGSAVRVQELGYLALFGTVQLIWIAALVYAVVRLIR
jgi:hypothetical protein